MTHRGYFSAIAGMVADEYRVERALCDAGRWPDDGYRSELPETLETFQSELLDACLLRYPGESIERTSRGVLTSFGNLATLGAYLAAEWLASEGARRPDTALPRWRRFVGDAWDPFLSALGEIPSAAVATQLARLDALTFALIDPLDEWLRQAGFEIRDEPEGLYFDVLRLPDE
jgi:hypothetical protein